jgi:hypothetical protein
MPISVVGKRSGRPDYSKPIGIDVPTPKADRKVVKQSEYWAAGEITPGPEPDDFTVWVVDKGFTVDHAFVPKNQRFRLYKLTVSVPAYITISVGIGLQDTSGNVTLLYWESGNQKVTMDFNYLRPFEEGSRPVYFLINYGDVQPDFVDWSVVGVVEFL